MRGRRMREQWGLEGIFFVVKCIYLRIHYKSVA